MKKLALLVLIAFSGTATAATRNFVPRGADEGNIGLSTKPWHAVYATKLYGDGTGITGLLVTELDPIFKTSEAYNITATSTSHWNTAYSWGNPAGVYLPIGGTAVKASALAAAGTTCTGTQAATGVDAAGNAVGCWSPAGTTYTADEASLHLAGTVFSAVSSSVTLRGNTFNQANKLVLLDGSSALPSVDGTNLTGVIHTELDPVFKGSAAYGITASTLATYNLVASSAAYWNAALRTETDPIFTGHVAYAINASSITHWNTAYSWGNHAGLYLGLHATADNAVNFTGNLAGDVTGTQGATVISSAAYWNGALRTETDPIWSADKHSYLTTSGDGSNLTGVLHSFTESDPLFTASAAYGITASTLATYDVVASSAAYWNAALRTETDPVWTADKPNYLTTSGNGSALTGVLHSFTESDPIFVGSAAHGIAAGDISNWNTAYSWGNHASAGYATYAQLQSTGAALTAEISRATARENAIAVSTGTLESNKVNRAGDTMTGNLTLGTNKLTAGTITSSSITAAGSIGIVTGNLGDAVSIYSGFYLSGGALSTGWYNATLQAYSPGGSTTQRLNFMTGGSALDNGTVRMTILNSGLIGINNNSPTYQLDVAGGGHFTSSMTVDGGYYGDGSNLTGMTSGLAGVAAQQSDFTAQTNGVQTQFTLTHTPMPYSLVVYQNGVAKAITTDYTLTGAVITMGAAPLTGTHLVAHYTIANTSYSILDSTNNYTAPQTYGSIISTSITLGGVTKVAWPAPGGVSSIIAGTHISLSPVGGTGDVTVNVVDSDPVMSSTFTATFLASGGDVFVSSTAVGASPMIPNMGAYGVVESSTWNITGVKCYTLNTSTVGPTSFNIAVSSDIGNTKTFTMMFTSSVTVQQNQMYSAWVTPNANATITTTPTLLALHTYAIPASGTLPSEYGCLIRYWRRLDVP